MSPGNLPRKGVFWSRSSASPITMSTAPKRISILAISPIALFHEEIEHPAQDRAHLLARDDHVDHAVLEQEFGALEPPGKLRFERLCDHAGPGEPDQTLR